MSRMFTKEICFFTTDEMYAQLKQVSKEMNISISYLIRTSIREFLESELNDEARPQGDGLVNNEERKEDFYV
jgi:predicted transcriptional regulator